MKIVYVLLLLGVSLTVSAQSDLSKQNVAVNQPFTLTISCNPQNPNDEHTPDQVVVSAVASSFRIRKTNTSDHEIIKKTRSSRGYGYDYEVRNSNGKLVGPKHPNEIIVVSDVKGGMGSCAKCNVLQPGESIIELLPLGGFDMSKPGTYTIQVSAHITNDPNSDVVKSNIITVTVLPEDNPPQAQQ